MTYRVFTPEALDAVAEFSLQIEIPEKDYPQSNPDGTRPVVTLKVDGTSIKFALAAMGQVSESEQILDVIASSLMGKDSTEDVTAEDEAAFEGLFTEIHEKFKTFTFTAHGESEQSVTLAVSAPSGLLAFLAFNALTTSQKLNALAASFMPVDHYNDDDEDYDY
jgi:hypothetical protein